MNGHDTVCFLFGFACATVCWVLVCIRIVTRRQRDYYELQPDIPDEELGI